jgi:hypothetical protein
MPLDTAEVTEVGDAIWHCAAHCCATFCGGAAVTTFAPHNITIMVKTKMTPRFCVPHCLFRRRLSAAWSRLF